MNWGHKITLAIVAFMSFILYMVVQASMKSVDLEAADYYHQEINYQSRMKAMSNASGLESKFNVIQEEENLVVIFPQELVGSNTTGTLHFFKPDDSKLDKKIEMKVGTGNQSVPLDKLSKGVYLLKIQWVEGDKDFYVEKALNLK